MGFRQILQSQWNGYGIYHQHKSNLLLHIIAVPIFMLGTVLFVIGLLTLSASLLFASLACMGISLAVQGRGHKLEAQPPLPFTSPGNAVSRLLLEQWITFPRFVLSGGWYRNLMGAARQP
jgi:hypothetical protein